MNKISVAAYRELIDACWNTRRDYHACVGVKEKQQWIPRMQHWIDELESAVCPRANVLDKKNAEEVIRVCKIMIIEKGAEF